MKTDGIVIVHVGPTNAKGGVAAVARTLAGIDLEGYSQLCVPTSAFLEANTLGKGIEFGRAIIRLRQILGRRKRRGDVLLHLHVSSASSLYRKSLIAAWARAHAIPYVAHLHSGRLLDGTGIRPGSLPFLLFRKLILGSRVTIVPLQYWMVQAQRKIGEAASDRVMVIPNPVDLPANCSSCEDKGETVAVGYYGSLLRSKGLHKLAEAFAMASKQHPALLLRLAGVGRRKDVLALTELIRRLGIQERVSIHGWLEGAARDSFLSGLAGFALLSESEWFGMAAIEAIAGGRRAVVTDLPSLRESLGELGVRYVPASSSLAEVAQELLLMTRCGPLSRSEMVGVRTRMAAYHPAVIGRRFGELYCRVFEGSGSECPAASLR